MGSSLIGNADHHHSLCENIPEVDKSFERFGNHYGTSHNKSTFVYEIFCKDPQRKAKQFFDKIAYGGVA